MHFNTQASQRRWDDLIKRFGDRAVLRQNSFDRPISVSIQHESAMERLGANSNPLDRVALVSPLDPDTGLPLDPPPSERDVLVASVEDREVLLKIVAPPDSMGADIRTQYWRIKVRA
jgi:hypothetical protein